MGGFERFGGALHAGPKANGAGIAADPTLTDTWSCSPNEWRARHLASDVSPSIRRSGCQARHRRSHRHPAPPSVRFRLGAPGPKTLAFLAGTDLQRAVPRPDFPWPVPRTVALACGPKTFANASSAPDRVGPIRFGTPSRVRHRLSLRRTEVLCMGSLKTRADRFRYVSGLAFFLSFRPLDRRDRKKAAPFRCSEAAPRQRILQARKGAVIHFSPISLWTRLDKSTA